MRAVAIFLVSLLMCLIPAPWPDSNCPQPGCLDAVEAARGCEDPLRGTEADTEAGQLRAEAQDVCHQLLDGPFRECHAQVWVGVEVVSGLALKGPKRQCAREIPEGEFGPASGLLWAVGQTALLSVSLGNETAHMRDL